MGDHILSKLSIQEYLKFEEKAASRHEYHNGTLQVIKGVSPNHSILSKNLLVELKLKSIKKGYIVLNGNMRVRIESSNRFLYPDASVVSGEVTISHVDVNSITNPVLIAEVLSEDTIVYDHADKFRYYQKLSSLQEYVLIDDQRPIVTVFFRIDEKIWEMREVIGLDQHFMLQSLKTEISLAGLYLNTTNLKGPFDE